MALKVSAYSEVGAIGQNFLEFIGGFLDSSGFANGIDRKAYRPKQAQRK